MEWGFGVLGPAGTRRDAPTTTYAGSRVIGPGSADEALRGPRSLRLSDLGDAGPGRRVRRCRAGCPTRPMSRHWKRPRRARPTTPPRSHRDRGAGAVELLTERDSNPVRRRRARSCLPDLAVGHFWGAGIVVLDGEVATRDRCRSRRRPPCDRWPILLRRSMLPVTPSTPWPTPIAYSTPDGRRRRPARTGTCACCSTT